MLEVLFFKGLPGSGKSTSAIKIVQQDFNAYKRVNKDDIRRMLDAGLWSQDAEKLVLKIQDAIILEALAAGKHVIVDNTNLAPQHEQRIRQLVKGKAEFRICDYTNVSLESCIKQDLMREHSVGEKVIRDMYNRYLRPPIPVIEYNPDLPDCMIVDIDGTTARMQGRSPYDWKRVGEDTYIDHVCAMVGANADMPIDVIFFSGRDEVCREETEKWLDTIPYSGFSTRKALFMRPANNNEKDSIIKERLYREHIEGKYNVRAVFDDRLQVCDMWYNLGLPLFRVGDPRANF